MKNSGSRLKRAFSFTNPESDPTAERQWWLRTGVVAIVIALQAWFFLNY